LDLARLQAALSVAVPSMPRGARVTPGGLVYHVLNRSVAGLPLFRKRADYEAFERIMIEAHERHPLPILAWCLMLQSAHKATPMDCDSINSEELGLSV
jgi:hypothetical protein